MTVNQLSYKVLERAVDPRLPGQRAEARAVRRAGDPDVLRLARRRHRAGAAAQHDHPAARHGRAAGDSVQQDGQHDHGARHDAGRRRSSSGSSSRTTSRAPRSSSTSRSSRSIATRAKQYGLNLSEYALGGVFSPEVSPGAATTTTTGTGTTATTTTTGRSTNPSGVTSPPPFNLNTISRGVQHGGLLPGGADGDRPVPRERHADQARREAAAARRRRAASSR